VEGRIVDDGWTRPSCVQGYSQRRGEAWRRLLLHINIDVQSDAGIMLTIMVQHRV
jgi:hypothetical protein